MSRTEVQEASAAVLLAAEAWYFAYRGEEEATMDYATARTNLHDAVAARFVAIARQDVKESSVFLRSDASEAEKQAARAAMIARPGWRKFIYELLSHGRKMSDRQIEMIASRNRGHGLLYPTGWVEVPDRKVTHQSLSSARKSLVDAGLVYAMGAEIHEGRRHTLWQARPL